MYIVKKQLEVAGAHNPTAENMAKWICDQFEGKCICVDVEESSNNVATYINTKHELYGKIAF